MPTVSKALVKGIALDTATTDADILEGRICRLVEQIRKIHEQLCINLNPAPNVMNRKAEALLSTGGAHATASIADRRHRARAGSPR